MTSIPQLHAGARDGSPFARELPSIAPRPPARSASERTLIAGIVLVILSSLGILAMTGSVFYAMLPALVSVLGAVVWTQPLRRTLLPVVFLHCVIFEPPYASGTFFTSVMEPAFRYANRRLSTQTGISILAFSAQELIYLALLTLMCIRVLRGRRLDSVGRSPSANVLFVALAVSLCTVASLEIWGLVTGGNFKATLFQIRSVLWLPLWAMLLSFSFRDSRDFRVLGLTITFAAVLKVAVGLYFVSKDAWDVGIAPAYMTSHEDSVLYVSLIVIWIAAWLHEGSWQRLLGATAIVSWMVMAVVVNDRRLAYVNLAGSLLAYYPLLGGRTKRKIKLGLILAAPLLAVYLFLARTHSEGIFGPGSVLMGIAKTADPSTQWRVLENQNLIYTIRENRLFGAGFGKEWLEVIKLPDVSIAFKEYRLIGHNSVLWLLGVAGTLGFALIWMPIVVCVYLATRSYHFAATPRQRTAAVAVVVITVCYVSQAWGDIGLGSSLSTLLMALALALAGKLARETGAWPSDARIV